MTTTTCAVDDALRVEGSKPQPVANNTYTLVNLTGPGVFIGGRVTKDGGSNDLTFMSLEIDGHSVWNLSFSAALHLGLTQQNPFGLMMLQSGSSKTFAFGFPTPLTYKTTLKLSAVVNETNVTQIIGTIIRG